MNWDTNEISMIIENDIEYYKALENRIGNELYFLTVLYVIIRIENENEFRIDPTKVNGNEVYLSFCKAAGNEQEGWCGNEH